ncbi:MAG: class I SAM-dependent methyltransferase [Pseudomonadota bacterium]
MTKPDKNKTDWSNYWQGRAAGRTGEVFAGVGVETSAELAEFWAATFAGGSDAAVIDIACGAGSVLKHAAGAGYANLIGSDISEDAIRAAADAVPGLMGLVASADALPLADASVDRAVSQFGFEYADRRRAAAEIARILRPGAGFTAVVHLKDGAIANECARHLAGLDTIDGSRFIPATRTLFAALFRMDRQPGPDAKASLDIALQAFTTAQAKLMPEVQRGGLAGHLHGGARQLYERRQAYAEQDISGWLDGMAAEIAAYRGRMEGMIGAAINEGEASAILATIDPSGNGVARRFGLGGSDAAWVLEARKPD